jgi:flagellar biogenesis protein FliO
MPRASLSLRVFRRAVAGAGAALIAGLPAPGARAGEDAPPPRVASVAADRGLSAATPATAQPFPRRGSSASGRRGEGRPEGTGSGWLGPAGIALALAVLGGVSLAARRGRGWSPTPGAAAATRVRVIGRTSLSPRHTVHLLGVGRRVLIVGTGPQGAPSLLGELTDDDPGLDDPPTPDARPPAAEPDADADADDGPGPAMLGRVVSIRRRPTGDDR